MSARNVLIGNGINIAFSNNDDYKNYEIISRLTKYLRTDRYNDVFNNSISSSELQTVLNQLNDFFKTMLKGFTALRLTQNEDEMRTLLDIARRYHQKSMDLISVGIEDYFFVMKMIFNRFGDEETPINALYDGLKYLFLDAIYNNGKIEKLHEKMGSFIKELMRYKYIFTLNYDTNLDKLTDKPVYHLHGSFDIFDDTYRPETIIGYLALKKAKPPTIIPEKRHLYCNAIMAFSGKRKFDIMNVYSNGNIALDTIIDRLKNTNDKEAQEKYLKLKTSSDKNDIYAYQSIEARLTHPKLRNTEYPIKEFKAINGELHILGLSPNNDSHIFDIINNNQGITQVVYFTASDEDTNAAQRVIKKPLQIKDVFKYWRSLEE